MNKILKVAFVLLLAFNYNSLRAQQDGQVDTAFNPSDTGALNGVVGTINVVAEQPDGKVLVGGKFSLYSGQVINNIIRLNNDETVDASFNSGDGTDGVIYGINLLSNGKILINGSFNSYDGNYCKGIARLNADGSFDASFVSTSLVNVPNGVSLVIPATDGKITTLSVDNYSIAHLRRLNADGTLDPTININVPNNIRSVVMQQDGKLLIGGYFNSFLSYPLEGLVRLNVNGTIDTTFDVVITGNDEIDIVHIQDDGKIIITKNEQSAMPMVRYNEDGSQDTTFQPDPVFNGKIIQEITRQPGGKVLVRINTNEDLYKRLNPDGSIDASFEGPEEQFYMYVKGTGVNGKLYVGGTFISINDELDNGLAKLNGDGTRDSSFYSGSRALAGADSSVSRVVVVEDNKLLISGSFRTYNGIERKGMAKLNEDGTLDATFTPDPTLNGRFRVQCSYPGGKILVVGDGTIRRLNPDGSIDSSFNALIFSDSGYTSAIQAGVLPNGKIIVAGGFTLYGTTPAFHMCRLNIDGSLDTTFMSPLVQDPNSTVLSVPMFVIDYDHEKILMGLIGGNNYSVQRYDFDGVPDTSFMPLANSSLFWVEYVAIESDGKILVHGYNNSSPSYRQQLLRLNANGSVNTVMRDDSIFFGFWNVSYLKPLENGKIYVAAESLFFTGATNVRFARLNNDGSIDTTFTTSQTKPGFVTFQDEERMIVAGAYTNFNQSGKKFIARLNTSAVLGVAIPQREANTIDVYRDNEMLNLSAPSGSAIQDIAIFDMAGRLVFKKANLTSRQESILLGNKKPVLVLKVTLTDGAVVEKKIY